MTHQHHASDLTEEKNTALLTSVIKQPPDVDRPFVLFLLELAAGLHQTLVHLGQIRCLRNIPRN